MAIDVTGLAILDNHSPVALRTGAELLHDQWGGEVARSSEVRESRGRRAAESLRLEIRCRAGCRYIEFNWCGVGRPSSWPPFASNRTQRSSLTS
jgi:hypothetical protein